MSDSSDPVRELEGLFARNLLSRRQFVAGLAALGLTASTIEARAGTTPVEAAAAPLPARYLVMVVLDAFRADYMNLAAMPHVRALAQKGIWYDSAWVGQIESLSPSGHASLSTGCLPKRTGVLGFEWRDPITFNQSLDGWPPGVLSGALERDLRESGTSSIALAVKTADPDARVVAICSEKVYAADALGGWAADYILYYSRKVTGGMLHPSAVPGHEPPASFLASPALQQRWPLAHFTDWDYLSTTLALHAFREFHPRALLVNLPGADVYGHPYGGPAAPGLFAEVARGVDRNIGRIVNAYKAAGIYDQTLFVVTADHGMVPNVRYVDGPTTKSVVRAAGGDYLFHTGGTAAYIYIRNRSAAPAVATAVARLPNVVGAYHLIHSGPRHFYMGAPGISIPPALDDAHRYLLGSFVGARAPDVVAPFRENTIGSKIPTAFGEHGGLNWGAQHVPLIMSGPGVRPHALSHFPARLTDVAPTILRLLGLSHDPMDGIVLSDSLGFSTAEEVRSQIAHGPSRRAYQTALAQYAAENIAEDHRLGLAPPPLRPLRP